MAPHVELTQKVRSALDQLYRTQAISEKLEVATLEQLSSMPEREALYCIDQYANSARMGPVEKQNGFFRGIIRRIRQHGIDSHHY